MNTSLFRSRSYRLIVLGVCLLFAVGFLYFQLMARDSLQGELGIEEVKGSEISIYLTKNGTQLQLYGQPYTFTGVNVYSAATLYGSNAGCGGQIDNLDALFSSLRPNSIVRFWGWQGSMVTNIKTKQPDWSGIDRVLSAASRYGHRVIISLGDQSGTCDDGLWKDMNWYNGGFMEVHNPGGMTPLSYFDFVQQVVTRYKDSPTIAMWELMNEPEAAYCEAGYSGSGCYGHQSCPDPQAAARSLRYFFDTVGGKIKQIDPNHLIESGVIGSGQCGADNWHYQTIHESPAIDVASYHDYGDPDGAMPGDQWNGLQVRLNQMKAIGKPLIIGEVGMLAQDNTPSCMSFASRRDKISAKINAQFPAGVAGYLPWAWASNNAGVCNYDIPPSDPLMTLLNTVPLREVTPLPSPTGIISPSPTPTMATVPTAPPTSQPSPTATSAPTSTATPVPTVPPTLTRVPNTPTATAVPTATPSPTATPTSQPVGDIINPTVSIVFPASSGVTRNTTITIQANASDNADIASVSFYVNNVHLCADSAAPYTCVWRVPAKKGVVYTIQAHARDNSGNGTSVTTKVTAK